MSSPVAKTWPRWAVAALLAATALLYLWGLPVNGYGNAFYAAAAQAGAQSWSAWFFGALDGHSFITVDKPPVALWVTGLSVRLFGMSSWSVLIPQALMGVATVAVLYAAVRRVHGVAAGLIAGAVLAVTPAAALMFRFNNPDALLVLLLVLAAYCLVRAVATGSLGWLTAVGAVMGTAFLTKMLQGFLVLPGFALAYLLYAPLSWRRRIRDLLAATGVLVVAAGWWVLVVQLVPAAARPYIGGSTDNNVLNLAFGYNGISRLAGRPDESAMLPAHVAGSPGLHRLFTGETGNEISWLLPAALACLVFGSYLAARGELDRLGRAALLMWGSWLIVTVLVLAYMKGMVHPYYTVALAPALAALVATATVSAWRLRSRWDGRLAGSVLIALAGGWSAMLLHHNQFGPSWLPWPVGAATLAAAAAVLIPGRPALTSAAAVVGVVAVALPVSAFSTVTAATPHHGSMPATVRESLGTGGWLGDESTNTQLAQLLSATTTPWSAATNGSQSAAALEVASGTSVMAIGGWSGDPVPTLDQFVADVQAGRITYYVEAGRRPGGEILHSASHGIAHTREIADWVAQHYPATVIGSSTVYRLR